MATSAEIKARIVTTLPRDLILDLYDVAMSRAREAHELVQRTDLSGRSARGLEGQARFRLMEQGFQVACGLHGGVPLEGDVIPGTVLRYFQPFMRFGSDKPGVVLGLASMPARKEIPNKNRSRLAGVSMNHIVSSQLDLDGTGGAPKVGDVFVLLLFARDREHGGRVDEVAIGLIDSDYASFLLYEPIERFLEGYAGFDAPPSDDGSHPLVTLKKVRKAFLPPETPDSDNAIDKPS